MVPYDSFSVRQKRAKQQAPDVFSYDVLQPKLKTQLALIYKQVVQEIYPTEVPWDFRASLYGLVTVELGTFQLGPRNLQSIEELGEYFVDTVSTSEAL